MLHDQREHDVMQFHDKHGFDVGIKLTSANAKWLSGSLSIAGSHQLRMASMTLNAIAQQWQHGTVSDEIENKDSSHDPRLLRAHLMVEELSEILLALSQRNEIDLLDGLADLQYVVSGTAVAFGMPLGKAFDEVHRSNMTKEIRAGGDKDVRCRKKGGSYRPPNLQQFIGNQLDTTA